MNVSVERPLVLYALLAVVPFVALSFARFRRLSDMMGKPSSRGIRLRFILRTLCMALSAVMLIVSLSGVSWGTVAVPVQKNGSALSLVFDISYSMNADDAPGGMTRLESAKSYASELLERVPSSSVSLVIAKGDGAVLVPLTDDMETVQGMISVLSPAMMTSVGTSLGAGIEAAIASFPKQSSKAGRIWLFTDGDETDGSLSQALGDALESGIPVAIIGFGSERETEVLAGDGATRVRTALRSDFLERTVASVQRKNMLDASVSLPSVVYIDASEVGSAHTLLGTISPSARDSDAGASVSYEVQPVDRSMAFVLASIVLLVLSFLVSELTFKGRRKAALLSASMLLLTGCSEKFQAGAKLFEGSVQWNRKNYQQAVAHYLEAGDIALRTSDREISDYALFGLATTYLMQDEPDAALSRFSAISEDAPEAIQFAVLYNSGIIAHRNGDYQRAASYFRDALRIDSTSVDAKINLELSLSQAVADSPGAAQSLSPVSDGSDNDVLEQALYSIIRENEQKQWKSQQQSNQSSSADY